MTEHKHAWFFRAIADGEPPDSFEMKFAVGLEWMRITPMYLSAILDGELLLEIRRKRETIMIGEREVTAPCRVPLKVGDKYFVPNLYDYKRLVWATWDGSTIDLRRLSSGLVFLAEEDAKNAAEAMLELLKEGK